MNDTHPSKPDKATVDAMRAEGYTYREIAKLLHTNYSAVYRLAQPAMNGAQGMPESAPTESISQECDSAPEYTRECTALADLEARLSAVEAIIATLQHPPYRASAPNGAPHRKRGFVIAQDLSERIDAFSAHYHLRVMDLLDTALREFLAARGWPGGRTDE